MFERFSKRALLMIGAVGFVSLLSGCRCWYHGATFSEAWDQDFASDPDAFAIVSPNDLTRDPNAPGGAVANKNWVVEASVVPADDAKDSLRSMYGNIIVNKRYFVELGSKLANSFGRLRNFRIVGTQAADVSGVTEVQQNAANRLTYNITQLSVQHVPRRYVNPVYSNGRLIRSGYWIPSKEIATVAIRVALLAADGTQRFSIEGTGNVESATSQEACHAALDAAVKNVMFQYAMKFAPPSYVTMLRGNGLFAKIEIGTESGLMNGMNVNFVQLVNLGSVGGQNNVQENVVAAGTIVKVGNGFAWCKVGCHHYRVVKLGTLVKLRQ